MRVLWAVLAVAAALALAGCSSQPNQVDPETVDEDDYEGPLVILGILIIVGVVLLAINLSRGGSDPKPPTPPTPPPVAGPTSWETLDEDEPFDDEGGPGEAPPIRKPAHSAAKPARRRAP